MRRLLSPATIGAGLRRLVAARGGNVLPLFAICLLPLVFATGMSIDYAKAMWLQSRLDNAADAAALAVVSKAGMDLPNRLHISPDDREELGRKSATEIFRATAGQLIDSGRVLLDLGDAKQFGVTVTDNPAHTSRAVSVHYVAQSPNIFAGILGVRTLTISGSAGSTVTAAAYTDIYVALDTSQSMGLAASDEDAFKLWQITGKYNGNSCQFGCHVPGGGDRYANDELAHKVGATLRIDVLRRAVSDMVQTARRSAGGDELYRFGLYRIGQWTSDILPLTSDLAEASNAADGITLGPNDRGGTGDTNLHEMTDYVFKRIEPHGDGTERTAPRAFLFIVTDGVIDTAGWCSYGHCTAPIDPATCQKYKDAGVTVGVVYTTYLPVRADPTSPGNTELRPEYRDLVAPFAERIAPNLRACASDGWFYEASDGKAIHAAMLRLFAQAIQTPILTR